MAQPITWRNVDAPDLRGAASMLHLANTSFNSGFDKLNQVLQNEQATAESNWKVQRDNNTQAFLNSINQYRTPEEYQAALTSGALDPSKFGAQIDQAAVRSALDGRLAILQDRAVKAINYGNTMTDAKEDPIKRAATLAILSGDKEGYARIIAENPNARFLPEVAGKNRDITHQNVTWDQEARTFDDNLKTNAVRRSLMGAQTNQANAAAENYRADNSDEKVALKTELAALKAQNEAAALKIKNSPLDAGTMDTYEGKKKFAEGLKALGITDSEVIDNIHKSFSRGYGNGVLVGKSDKGEDVRIGLPVATSLEAVAGAGKDWMLRPNWFIGSNRGGRALDRVKELVSEPSYVSSLQEAIQAQGIQYRPLTAKASDTEAPATARSALPKPTNARLFAGGDPGVDPLDASGAALMNQVIQARAEKAKSTMTPAEIEEAQKTGKLPFRIKQLLESQNER